MFKCLKGNILLIFHLHEENAEKSTFSPKTYGGITAITGLMVDDVDSVMAKALAAGAKETSPATSYGYGYRQGGIDDPFGHRWTVQMVI